MDSLATSTIFVFLFVSGCTVEQPKFETTAISSWGAISRGAVKEALAAYESQAIEAEKNALSSVFPQQHWETATAAYKYAAQAARNAGHLQKSIQYAERALFIAEKTKEPHHQLNAIKELVGTYSSIRNFEKSMEYLNKGFTTVKEIPQNTNSRDSWEGILYGLLGAELIRRKEYSKTIDAYSQAIYMNRSWASRLSSRSPDFEIPRTNIVIYLGLLGTTYRLASQLDQALEQYQQAFNSIKEWGLKYPYENDLYWGIGDVYRRKKDFNQALKNFNMALAIAESQRRPGSIRSASGRIGDVLMDMGKPAEAIPYFQKTIDQIESIRSLLQSIDYRQSYFEGALGAYVQMMLALLQSGKQEEAFNYSERARSRAFLDVLGSKVQLSRVKSGLLEQERALNEQIAAIKAGVAGQEEGTDREILRRELREAERAYNTFLTKIRKEDKEQASLMTVEPLTLKQVQELLELGTTLISYFVTTQGSRVWVIEKEKIRFIRIPLAKTKLSGLVRSLRESVFTPGERDKFTVASTYLYRYLIQPLLPHITGKELIIVPHDVLHYLPFHALLSPDGRYLIEKYPIYYLSSASLLQFTKEKRKAKGDLSAVLAQVGKVLAFGNPDLGDPQKDLQFAELEAGEVRRLYPKSTVFLRKEATEERAKGLASQYDILHFAAHAELKEEDPLSSAILLAKDGKEDGRLEVREVFGMNLNASLVVLSACETGLGKLSSGDELVGLTRAFIYAGTPSVVASLWKVDDASTANLMGSFYKNLRTMTKVEALRQAQLEMIRGDGAAGAELLAKRGVGGIGKIGETPQPKLPSGSIASIPTSLSVSTSHPYFWAPFILVGDGK